MGASVVLLGDGVRSGIAEIRDSHWTQNLVLVRFSTETAFNGDQPCFVSDGGAVAHHDTGPAKSCFSISATISVAPHYPLLRCAGYPTNA